MKIKDISACRIKLLESGEAETTNLVESLAINLVNLIKNKFPFISESLIEELESNNKFGFVVRIRLAGELLYKNYGDYIIQQLKKSNSDLLRGMACFSIASQENLSFASALYLMKEFADDCHFGVRELAWLALRPKFMDDVLSNIKLLVPLCDDESENIRRFVSELTRPRGVWCAHIKLLKEQPWLAISIIENLKNDNSIYVQKSVGNWLNDASKTSRLWVVSLLEEWQNNKVNISGLIIRLATRSILKEDVKKS
jgi:3-methyladenine DNA glycosylase AlkC